MTDSPGMSASLALAFLARQQMLATAMQFAIAALNNPSLKGQSVAALRDLADTAERDCEGVEVMGASYSEGLRRYALILETGEYPDGELPPPILTVINGGRT